LKGIKGYLMARPTFSSKLRRETKRYHSSLAVVLLVVFCTVTVFLFILAVKGIFDNKKKNAEKSEPSSSKELEEVKVEPQTKEETKYNVKSGDNLYSIGIKFGVNWKDIAKANNLEEPYNLTVGQELTIPKGNGNK